MKRLIQICLILVVLIYGVSCAPSHAVVSGSVGVGVGAYPPPVFVRPYGYYRYYPYPPVIFVRPYRYYYHPGYRYYYHYRGY